jgi:hypothetical protein
MDNPQPTPYYSYPVAEAVQRLDGSGSVLGTGLRYNLTPVRNRRPPRALKVAKCLVI